ncbi:MAG TPA: peptidoglycan DD-metalloendopeptidase family protein, partial [Flavobacterium sp.]|nr:peptidoglycan DD-metalloendopeptidase family protein [Flavobacterium sp.]
MYSLKDVKVIDPSIPVGRYTAIDLSESNRFLTEELISDTAVFELYIEDYLNKNNALVAYGGYNETRSLYRQNTIFKSGSATERNRHIGLDLWIKAGTAVVAALDGRIHSFKENKAPGDYGPALILEHHIESHVFYTLYGHLSRESLLSYKVGLSVKKGETIGSLGDASVNGGYAPHLHFQIIKDLQGNFGDYP